jgi:hypothetical protein
MNAEPAQIVPVSGGLWAATLSEGGFCDALGLKKVGDCGRAETFAGEF